MMATWWQGPYEEFIRVSQEGWDRGVRILHFLGGSTIDVNGDHAVAQTKMTITQRVEVHDVLCDVVCTGRFYDFLAHRDERWGMVLRQPIYEIDRLTPVSPVARAGARRRAAGALPRGLPPPRLRADARRLRGQARHARPRRPRARAAVRAGPGVAEGLRAWRCFAP